MKLVSSEALALPGFERPANETLAGRIAEQIKRRIITGQLAPGQKLVEKELAAACSASRTPLREALNRLVNEGLAVGVPYRGIFVRRISLRQARDIYELRIGAEGLAAMLAARRRKKTDLARMEKLLVAIDRERPGDEADELKLLNERFHRTIALATGNALLVQQVDDLWSWVNLARTASWTASGRGATSRDEHHSLYGAIRDQDEAAARALAEIHVRRAWETIEPLMRAREAEEATGPKDTERA